MEKEMKTMKMDFAKTVEMYKQQIANLESEIQQMRSSSGEMKNQVDSEVIDQKTGDQKVEEKDRKPVQAITTEKKEKKTHFQLILFKCFSLF